MPLYTFGGFDFGDGVNYRVIESPELDASDRDMHFAEFARREGGKLLATRDRAKLLTFRGFVSAATAGTLRSKVDDLQKAFAKEAQALIYHVDGDTRRVTATRRDLDGRYGNGRGHLIWEYRVTFLAASPYAQKASADQDSRSLTLNDIGGGQYQNTYTVSPGGTAFNRPVFTITVPAATAYGITELWVANTTVSPLQQIKLIQSLVATDVVAIDCDAFTVKVNGVAAPVTRGQFPVLDPVAGATNTIRVRAKAGSAPTLNPVVTDWTTRYHN